MSAAALLALAGSLAVWPPTGASVRTRFRSFPADTDRRTSSGSSVPATLRPPTDEAAGSRRRRWALAVAVGLGAGLLIGGVAGAVVGAGVGVATERLLRRADGRADADVRGLLLRDLPAACDLLAVCLAGGLPVGSALGAVAVAVSGPLGNELAQVAGLYRLGADARVAWAAAPTELAALGRVVVRAGESGSAIGSGLHSLAAEARASAGASTEAAVRRAGVWVLAPLGLCHLPAFVCLGVAPLVIGIARDVFG